jgi:hypothetical protein
MHLSLALETVLRERSEVMAIPVIDDLEDLLVGRVLLHGSAA